MKAFVTGGTGLLGSNIILELVVARGAEVKALVRTPNAGSPLCLKTTRVIGDLREVTS